MKNLSIAATLFLAASAAHAVDFIDIHAFSGSVTINERALVNNGTTTEWQIDITVSGGTNSALVAIRPQTSSNNYPIRYIKIRSVRNGSLNNNANIVIDELGGGHISLLRSVQTLTASPSPDAEVWISTIDISGVLGDPGSPHTSDGVFADVVGSIQAAGDVTADIVALAPLFGGTSTVTLIRSTGGSILGDIGNAAGGIAEVTAATNIGSSGSPILIVGTGSGGNIGVVTGSSVYADIATDTAAGAHGDTKQVVATSGDFVGSLTTYALQGTGSGIPAIDVAGDLDADLDVVTVKRPITVDGSLPSGRRITVHEDVKSTGPITFGTGGLQGLLSIGTDLAGTLSVPSSGLGGQVIINSADTGGTWTSSVTVGGTALATTPYYSNSSASVGGGAVGLVPYYLHQTDCEPPYNADGSCTYDFASLEWPDDPFGGETRDTIVLRHYGPVFNSSENGPYTISLKSVAGPGRYGTLSVFTDKTYLFDVYLPPDKPREVWISYKLDSGLAQTMTTDYQYKVELATDSSVARLRCDGTLAATAPEVAGYPYIFNPFCPYQPAP